MDGLQALAQTNASDAGQLGYHVVGQGLAIVCRQCEDRPDLNRPLIHAHGGSQAALSAKDATRTRLALPRVMRFFRIRSISRAVSAVMYDS